MREVTKIFRQPLNVWLERIIVVVIALTLLVPLVTFSGVYFPYVVPRNIFFRVCVGIAAVVYTLLILRDHSYRPRLTAPTLLYLGFIGIMTVASFFGGNIGYSFFGNFERMDGLFTWYILALYIVILVGVMRTREMMERLLWASLFVAYMTAVVGISQLVGVDLLQASSGGDRITSTLGNATYFSAYLLMHFAVAVYAFVRSPGGRLTSVFVWLPIPLILVLAAVHARYGIMMDKVGIIEQIFSHWAVIATFATVLIVAWGRIVFKQSYRYQIFSDRVIAGVLGVVFLILIFSTQTRGALVGLGAAVVAVLIGVMVGSSFTRRVRIAALSFLIIAVVAVGSLFIFKDAPFIANAPILARVTSISVNDATTLSRLATWRSALRAFAERPITGWGVENFHIAFNKYFPVAIYTDEGTPLWFDRPHNLLIQYAIEGGVFAVLAYLLFLGSLIRRAFVTASRSEALFVLGTVTAYIVQNLFVFDSVNSYIIFSLFVAFFGSVVFASHPAGQPSDDSPPRGHVIGRFLQVSAFFVAVFVMGGALWLTSIRPLKANAAFVGYYFQQTNSELGYDSAVTDRVFALFDTGPFLGKPELLGVYSEYAVDRIRERTASDEDLKKLVQGLGERFDRERERGYTSDARFIMYQMNLYLNAGVIDPVYYEMILPLAEKALALSPDRPQLYYIRGRAFMDLERYDEGIADFTHAVSLAPAVPDARANLFAAFVTVGDIEAARLELDALKKIVAFDTDTYARFTRIYVSGKLYDEAVQLLEEAKSVFPDDALALQVGIAEVYALGGRITEARDAMREAVAMDASAAEYAEEFYRRLEAGDFTR